MDVPGAKSHLNPNGYRNQEQENQIGHLHLLLHVHDGFVEIVRVAECRRLRFGLIE